MLGVLSPQELLSDDGQCRQTDRHTDVHITILRSQTTHSAYRHTGRHEHHNTPLSDDGQTDRQTGMHTTILRSQTTHRQTDRQTCTSQYSALRRRTDRQRDMNTTIQCSQTTDRQTDRQTDMHTTILRSQTTVSAPSSTLPSSSTGRWRLELTVTDLVKRFA